MAVTAAQLNQLYLAYFGRPADFDGIQFYTANPAATIASVAANFSASPESQSLYGSTFGAAQVNAIYQVLFNRAAEPAGLAYWSQEVASGRLTPAMAAYGIMIGAQNADKTTVDNKLAIATAFVAQLDTAAEITGYSGAAAAQAARAFLATVTDTAASLAAANTALASQVAAAVSLGVTGIVGSTFTLTTGIDSITGTANNDTINASAVYDAAEAVTTASTLGVSDTIAAGTGTDTLNLTISGAQDAAVVLPAASYTGLEVMNVRNTVAQTASLDASTVAGLTNFNADRSIGAVTVTNLAAGGSVGMIGDTAVTNGAVNGGYVATATSAIVNVSGGTKAGAITITGAGLTSATVNSGGAANTVGAVDLAASKTITVNASTNFTTTGIATTAAGSTLTVVGAATSVSVGALDADVTTVSAAGLTSGGLTATLSADTTTKVTGGAGNDVITTGAVLTTGTVDAGAGTADRLVIAGSTHVATATLAGKYTNFEVVQVQDGVSQDVSLISGITAVRINDGAGATAVTNLTAAQAAAITVVAGDATGAITIGVKDATVVNQLDTVKIDANDGAATVGTIALGTPVLAGVETLEVTATDNVTIAALTSASALSSIVFKGAGTVGLTTGAISTANAHIDSSAATGVQTIDASGWATNGVKITGGSAADSLTGSGQADVIIGGAGNDTITGGAGADTLTGGDGVDTFVMLTATIASGNDTITDFTAGTGGDRIDLGFLTIPAALTAVSTTAAATIATNTIYTVNLGAAIGTTDYTSATGFATLFGAGKAFGTTVATTDDVLIVVQGTDKSVLIAIENPAATTLANTDIDAVVTLTGVTNAATFVAANFV